MNKIVLFLILAGLSLAGCHEVTVGYMKTEHAAYPIDSLQIFDTVEIRNEISRLQSASVSLADSLRFAMDSLLEESEIVYEQYLDRWFKELRPLDVQLDDLLKDSINHVAEIVALKEQLQQLEAELDLIYDKSERMKDEAYEIKIRLDQMDPSEDQTDASVLETLKKYRLRVANRISWTTSEIEGVDGTAPIFYSISAIRAEKGGNAEIFRSELQIKGNGRMEVPYDFKAPAGVYHISIQIKNEGYTRILEDVFRFIINPVVVE